VNDDLDIRVLHDATEMRRLTTLFNQVWGTITPPVGVELLRAIQHAGGYVVATYLDDQVVGGSLGFLGRHEGAPSLHSHITGILPGLRRTGLGRAMKLHQRAWAVDHDLTWVTWTFDPLVRRNAWFNIDVLGAHVHEYLVDFYGPIDDAINAGDESDRLLVAWPTIESDDAGAAGADPGDAGARPAVAEGAPAVAVATPDDIVVLRRTDRAAATAWRQRVRLELGGRLARGGRVAGFTREGEYLVVEAP
jgi:predicted GNAT superfamily acetyltransferase